MDSKSAWIIEGLKKSINTPKNLLFFQCPKRNNNGPRRPTQTWLTEPFLRAIRRVGGIAGRQNPGSIPCLLVDNQNCVDGPCSGSAWCCNRYQCHRFMYRGTCTLEHCLFVRFPFCLLALWQGRLVSNGQAANQLIKLLYGHKQLTTSGMGWQSRIKAHSSTKSTASILDHSVETLNIWQMCFFAITTLVSLIAVVAANPFTVSLSAEYHLQAQMYRS